MLSTPWKVHSYCLESYVSPIVYRPFDNRWIYYNPKIIEKGDSKYPTLRHMLKPNVGLLVSRIQAKATFNAVFISRHLVEMKTAESTRSSTVFPLYGYVSGPVGQQGLVDEREANMDPSFVNRALASWRMEMDSSDLGDLDTTIGWFDLLHYVYAVLHSPAGRNRYSDQMRVDFPRIPIASEGACFRRLAHIGADLVAAHLLEDDYPAASWNGPRARSANPFENPTCKPQGKGEPCVTTGHPRYVDGAVYVNADFCFDGVPETTWQFQIGGYQVARKWLKDRGPKKGNPGRVLTDEDIVHYQKIVVALSETIRLMAEVDKVIDAHGGWPDAFVTQERGAKGTEAARSSGKTTASKPKRAGVKARKAKKKSKKPK